MKPGKKAPSSFQKRFDSFVINALGPTLMAGIGAATAFAVGGLPWLAGMGALTALKIYAGHKIDVPRLLIYQNLKNLVPKEHPVSRVSERLAKKAGLEQAPACIFMSDKIFKNQDNAPFLGTIGTSKSSVIIVSSGIEEELSESELEAALAHEITHIKKADTNKTYLNNSFLTLASSGIIYLGLVAGLNLMTGLPNVTLPAIALTATPFAAAAGIAVAGTFCAAVVGAAISRAQERRADRGSVALTKNPWALASGLGRLVEISLSEMKRHNAKKPGPVKKFLIRLFRQHPKTKLRRKTLMAIGREMIKHDPEAEAIKQRTIAELEIFEKQQKKRQEYRRQAGHHILPRNNDDHGMHKLMPDHPFGNKKLPFNNAAREQDNKPNTPQEKNTAKNRPPRCNIR